MRNRTKQTLRRRVCHAVLSCCGQFWATALKAREVLRNRHDFHERFPYVPRRLMLATFRSVLKNVQILAQRLKR